MTIPSEIHDRAGWMDARQIARLFSPVSDFGPGRKCGPWYGPGDLKPVQRNTAQEDGRRRRQMAKQAARASHSPERAPCERSETGAD